MIQRTFKYRLHPTVEQAKVMLRWLGVCREVFNASLQERRDAYRTCGKTVSRYEQYRELTDVRANDSIVEAVPLVVLRSAVARVDLAYKAFFRRVKSGKKPGYPRFRGIGTYHSFGIGRARDNKNRVFIPKIGTVRFNLYRPIGGIVRDAVVRFDGRKWWVSFACTVGDAPPKVAVKTAVGIDLGLKEFATLSNGETIHNPRYYRKSEAILARRQQSLSRKQRGSASRARARYLVAKAHAHVRGQRQEFARKLTVDLFKRFDLVSHEALDIPGLIDLDENGGIKKSINDAGWRIFIAALQSKAESAGKHAVAVDPRGTTKKCSACGTMVPKALRDRVHRCSCGYVADRDVNAAINIHRLGLSLVEPGPSGPCEAESLL